MKKHIRNLLFSTAFVIMIMTCFAFSASAKTSCYKYTTASLDPIFEYMTEIYIKKYPDFGLSIHYGTPSDAEVLKKQAVDITKGCKTEEEKITAIAKWIKNNIEYDYNTSAQFSIDVLIEKDAVCLGYAYLLSDMLRSIGIPAVPISGYRGDMVNVLNDENLTDIIGHAWTYVYTDNEWKLYDILWDWYGVTDKEEINKWYFTAGIEGTIPYYKGINYELYKFCSAVLYKKSKFYFLPTEDNLTTEDLGNINCCINISYQFSSEIKRSNDGFKYLENNSRRSSMADGECYSNGWAIYGNFTHHYFQPNGVEFRNTINKIGDKYTFETFQLNNDIDEYCFYFNELVICSGETLSLSYIEPNIIEEKGWHYEYSIINESEPGVATVDKSGKITAKKDAYVLLEVTIKDDEGVLYSSQVLSLMIAKTSKFANCEYERHIYKTVSSVEPTENKDGKIVKKCISCGKTKSKILFKTSIIMDPSKKCSDHSYKTMTTITSTCVSAGKNIDKCINCGSEKTTVNPVKSHSYGDYETTRKATLSEKGEVVKKCSDCGKKSKAKTVYSPKTIKLSATSYTYNGEVKKPDVTVKDSKGNTLKKDTDYTVKYEKGRKTPGKYTVTITFKGKYTGIKKLTFKIVPKAIGKITSSQTTSTITLKWSKITGVDDYRVYKYNSKTKKYQKLKDVTGTSLKISDLKSGTAYKYKVRAYTKDNGTIWGDYSKVFETATKPKTPALKVSSPSKGKVTFNWTDISGESGYQVYYSAKKDGDYKKLKVYKANTVKGSKSKLKSKKTYYFKVRAYKKTASGTVYSSWSSVKAVKIK